MCMTLVLSEPMARAVASATCRLEWSNFTECVVTYVVTRTNAHQRFSGVISTAVLHYVEVRPETRLSVYVPQLCLALVVLLVNGWLLVSLQGGSGTSSQRHRPIGPLLLSLTAAYGLQGAVNVYTMTSLVASTLAPNPLLRNPAGECLAANAVLLATIISAVLHQVALAGDRLHHACKPVTYRTIWTRARSRWLIAGLWFVSLLVAFLPVMGWRTRFSYCLFFYQYPKGYLHLLTAMFAVAVAATAGQYAYVVLRVGPGAGTFAVTGASKSWSRHRRKRDARLTSTVAVMGVVGSVLWTPLFLHLSLACPTCAARSDNDFILLGVFALALTNALLAPLLYAFRLKQLRHLVSDVAARWALCRGVRRSRSGTFELATDAVEAGKRDRPLQQQQQRVATINGAVVPDARCRNLLEPLPAVHGTCSKLPELAPVRNSRRHGGSVSPAVTPSSTEMANGDFLY